MGRLKIQQKYSDPTLNLTLDTIGLEKQALVFVNTRRGAESQAEKIAAKTSINLDTLSQEILNVLPRPTKQCKRLSECVKKGTAFHHSGLHFKQRELIEENFRKKVIKIICATPTLAMGVDMPAFRVILRDLKRFGHRGMQWIPVLEYEQMSGRCGRPSFDKHGEAICVSKSESEKETLWEMYVEGDPEEITSKLAVEPVLRTYVLSLIATGFCKTKDELFDFFERTFYAHQYEDTVELDAIINKMVGLLQEWDFVEGGDGGDFVSASEINEEGQLIATQLGKRVSELYLDPYTAHNIIKALKRAQERIYDEFSWLQLISSCLEMRPLLRVKKSEYERIREESLPFLDSLLVEEPSEFEYEYEVFLDSVKTGLFFKEWIDEKDEDYLLDKFDIRPGEVQAKRNLADWLLYATHELTNILGFKKLLKDIAKLRARVNYGVKEELLTLLKLKNIGRVRARKLYKNGIKDIGDMKKVDITKLVQILGKKTAINVKKQVGIDLEKAKVPERKRKGQINLNDYGAKE